VSEWELITNKDGDWTDRMAVPGGWLYRNTLRDDAQEHNPMLVTMVFVPGPDLATPLMPPA